MAKEVQSQKKNRCKCPEHIKREMNQLASTHASVSCPCYLLLGSTLLGMGRLEKLALEVQTANL